MGKSHGLRDLFQLLVCPTEMRFRGLDPESDHAFLHRQARLVAKDMGEPTLREADRPGDAGDRQRTGIVALEVPERSQDVSAEPGNALARLCGTEQRGHRFEQVVQVQRAQEKAVDLVNFAPGGGIIGGMSLQGALPYEWSNSL